MGDDDKKKQEKKEQEPKVKDLTEGAEAELGDKGLDKVSGGRIVFCAPKNATCTSLRVLEAKRKPLAVGGR